MDVSPNLADYEALTSVFEWDHIYEDADWDAPDELNVAHEVCDRHAEERGLVALYFVGRDGERERITFWEFADWSNRFANALSRLGVERGDPVIAYAPRVPETYVAMLGTLKAGAVFGRIEEGYGADQVAYRLEDSGARVVLTTPSGRETVARAIETGETAVEDVVVVSDDGIGIRRGDVSYYEAVARADDAYETTPTGGSDPALLYYTSGVTGPPKGIAHGHRWIVGAAAAQWYAGDLLQHGTDCYWGTGDRGFLTAPVTSLGVWFWGHSCFASDGDFDPETWAGLLGEFPITILSSVPACYRGLRAADDHLDGADLDLHRALSTGEPIDADLIEWGESALGVAIHDTYGQAETGNMLINTYPSIETRPESMGKPLPGVTAAVVDPADGTELEAGAVGELAVRGEFPSFFLGYWEDPDRTEAAFVDDWYLTGDLAVRDEDGYFWYRGRADDAIVSAGTRVGPYTVEEALEDHDLVAEAAAVATAHPNRGEAVRAVVVPATDAPPQDLEARVRSHAEERLPDLAVPIEIERRASLPRTGTGAIRRHELADV